MAIIWINNIVSSVNSNLYRYMITKLSFFIRSIWIIHNNILY